MKQTVKKWTAMMMQHRCFEIWIPLSYVLLLLSLLYLKPKRTDSTSLIYEEDEISDDCKCVRIIMIVAAALLLLQDC